MSLCLKVPLCLKLGISSFTRIICFNKLSQLFDKSKKFFEQNSSGRTEKRNSSSVQNLSMAFAGNAQVLAEEEEEEEEGTLIEEEVGSESPLQNAEQTVIVVVEEEEEEQGARAERVSASSSTRNDNNGGASPSPSPSSSSRGSAERLTEDSGVFSCTICWEPWTSDGVHRVCSLPCGHLYGRSCIMKWIQQCGRTNGKCPQCKRKLKLRDIRTLYAPRIAVADEDLQKEVISLRSENEFLKLQKASLLEEVDRQKVCEGGHVIGIYHGMQKLLMAKEACERQRVACSDQISLGGPRKRLWECTDERVECQSLIPRRRRPSCSFVLQEELMLDGARLFDMDTSSQLLLVSQKVSGGGGMHILKKMSLLNTSDCDHVHLPPGTGAVRDLRISPGQMMLNNKNALVASLGKKLSIVSLQSNSIVLTYALSVPAWSCSWDLHDSNHVYAGLQNGTLMIFDLRQTAQPMESISGLASTPIHTIYSLAHNADQNHNHGSQTVLSAAAAGPCLWNTVDVGERPFLIPGLENDGVCISLAYYGSTGNMVASFRPKVLSWNESQSSQPLSSPLPSDSRLPKPGSHFLIKRANDGNYQKCGVVYGNVSATRLPKSAVISLQDNKLFACADEVSNGLCLWDLESRGVVNYLRPHHHPILDVKYTQSSGPGLLGCLSDNTLQIFTCSQS